MNTNQIQLVQSTFDQYVAPLGDAAAAVFYDILFRLDGSLQSLFKGDMAVQRNKLVQTLTLAVKGLEQPDQLLPVVRELGRRHIGYGVQPDHYAIVGQALSQTLEVAIGSAFTSDVREAWSAAYALLSSTMQSTVPDYA